jgi:hypothetical protein
MRQIHAMHVLKVSWFGSIPLAVYSPSMSDNSTASSALQRPCPQELLAGSLLWSSTMPAFGRNFFVKMPRIVSFLLSPRPLLSHEEMRRFLDSGGSIDKRDGGILPRIGSSSRVNGSNLADFSSKKGDPVHLAELQQKYPKVPDLIFQQRLGSGASGEVLLVNDMTNGSNVALKRIVVDLSHLNRVSDQDPLGDVLAEVDCLKILSDKRVVAYKGCFFDGDGLVSRFCILMEYCPGQSLWHKIELVRRDTIARQKLMSSQGHKAAGYITDATSQAPPQLWLGLTPQFIAKIFRQMVEGLCFLHLHGVIHAGDLHNGFLSFMPSKFASFCLILILILISILILILIFMFILTLLLFLLSSSLRFLQYLSIHLPISRAYHCRIH